MAMWYNAKQVYETKFQSGIEHYLSEMEVEKRIRDEQEFQEMERKALYDNDF